MSIDLSAISAAGDSLGLGVLESEDYSRSFTTPIGDYISNSRQIKANKKPDGKVSFEITLVGGLVNPDTGKVFEGGKYPLKTWITPTLYKQEGREGETSSLAQYLNATGFNPKELGTEAEILEALTASQSVPCKVFVSRTDRSVKNEDGTYSGGNQLKQRDFLKPGGDKKNPADYLESVVIEGATFRAKAKVSSFSRL